MRRISKRVGRRFRPFGIERILSGSRGQATVEYILILIIIISGAFILIRGLQQSNALSNLATPLQEDFARAYQFGHPKAKAESDRFELHPRMGNAQLEDGVVQSRIFIYLGER